MWDTVEIATEHLSHDRPCPYCGHASHRYLPCDFDCGCRVDPRLAASGGSSRAADRSA